MISLRSKDIIKKRAQDAEIIDDSSEERLLKTRKKSHLGMGL